MSRPAVPVLEVGPGGLVLDANDAFCVLVGMDRDAIVGDEPPYSWWPKEQYAWFAVQLGEHLDHAAGRGDFSGRVRRADGTTIGVTGHVEPDEQPDHVSISIQPTDESEGAHDSSEPELEEYLRRMFDAGAVGMISGRENHVLRANDAFLAIIGYSRDEFDAGEIDWAALTPPEFFDADAAAGETMLRTGSAGPIEKQYLHHDGRRVWVRVAGTMLSRLPFRWSSTVEDTTVEHEARIEHDTAMADLEEQVDDLTVERDQLQRALDSRVVIEQAKGRLAGELDISTTEAFTLLRERARQHGIKLRDLARSVSARGARALPRPRSRSQR